MKHSLLFGNGLNLLGTDAVSWDALLEELQSRKLVTTDNLPYTMKYEKIFLERSDIQKNTSLSKEIYIKNQISKILNAQNGNEHYDSIIELGFDNYLTTNYDHAFNKSFDGMEDDNSTEEIYSVRRNTILSSNKNKECRLWNIHGSMKYPKTIMLGLDHYCGSISKIDAYIKGHYEYQNKGVKTKVKSMVDKIKCDDFDGVSWVELFFNTNLHILGLSLDYSETDLWWVLNKRARLMLEVGIKNKIYFHDSNIPENKKSLLASMNVEVVEQQRSGDDYLSAHLSSMEEIRKFSNQASKMVA